MSNIADKRLTIMDIRQEINNQELQTKDELSWKTDYRRTIIDDYAYFTSIVSSISFFKRGMFLFLFVNSIFTELMDLWSLFSFTSGRGEVSRNIDTSANIIYLTRNTS